MVSDPYKVLGVSPDQEAARKMQEVNAAYEQIKNPERASSSQQSGQGSYGGGYGYDPFGGFGGGYQRRTYTDSDQADRYQQGAYQYIRMGRYEEALNILSNSANRNARWYYLSALANDGMGNQVTALEHIRKAVSMDPDNMEYLSVLEQIENGGNVYRRHAGGYGGFDGRNAVCPSMCLCYFAQLFCCRGGFFWC